MANTLKLLGKEWGGYVLSGLFLGVGFVWAAFWPLCFVGISVFLHTLSVSTKLKQVLLGSVLTFTIKICFAIIWFWSTYPIIWIDLALGKAELPVIGFYWLTVSLSIGLAGAVFGFFCYQLRSRAIAWWSFIWIAPLWVLSEILGSIFFSIFTLGPGGTVNAVFSFGYSGYLLGYHDWLLAAANFGGVYALSALAATIGTGLYVIWHKSTNQNRVTEVIICLLLLLSLSTTFASSETEWSATVPTTTVAVVDTTFGGEAYFASENREMYRREQVQEALAAALESGANYVVMPEDSRYLNPQLSPEAAYGFFRFQQGDPSAVVVEAGPVPIAAGTALRATIYDGVAKKAYGIDKQYLVPQGEFMPLVYKTLLTYVGAGTAAQAIDQKLQYRPGPMATQANLSSHLPGVLFCFASADPLGVRSLTQRREVPFIAHPISHAWFHEPKSLWLQLDSMLKIHAVWNDVPIVSAGNMVAGALYTKDGEKKIGQVYKTGDSWRVSLVGW